MRSPCIRGIIRIVLADDGEISVASIRLDGRHDLSLDALPFRFQASPGGSVYKSSVCDIGAILHGFGPDELRPQNVFHKSDSDRCAPKDVAAPWVLALPQVNLSTPP
jgi:hypothetical protein